MKKARILVILGIICLVGSFIWMLISQSSIGPFFVFGRSGRGIVSRWNTFKE